MPEIISGIEADYPRKARFRLHPVLPYVAPMVVTLVLVSVFPLLFSIYLSFAAINPNLQLEFQGLANYLNIFRDLRVWRSLLHSAVLMAGSVLGQFLLGLASALLLHQQMRNRRWARLALLLPWVIPPVVTTLTWRWMLDSRAGLINDWLTRVGVLKEFRSWIGLPDTALLSAVVVSVWRGFPFVMIMLLAGLQAIQKEYYEAAEVDGASPLQRFWHITIPGLRYTIAVATTIAAIWAFKEFAIVFLLTEGGPAGASEVVVTLVYKMFFLFARFGDAAALGVIVLGILLGFAGIYVRLVLGRGNEE
jgi:multiple sugar transport system permease protein